MQIGDEEKDREKPSHTQPQKSDSASSFRISPSKANQSGSSQKQLPSAANVQSPDACITDRHADRQYLVLPPQQQAGESAQQLPHLGPTQSGKHWPEPLSNASFQQLLPEQDEEGQQLLSQLHEGRQLPQQIPQQLRPPEITPSRDNSFQFAEQVPQHHQQISLADQPLALDRALAPARASPKHLQLQQHEQQDSVVSSAAKNAFMLPSTEHGEEWNSRQLVAFSLQPSRLWAFLGLGIPGGLASSVQSAAYEVTTAMAGVLGEAHVCKGALAETCLAVHHDHRARCITLSFKILVALAGGQQCCIDSIGSLQESYGRL